MDGKHVARVWQRTALDEQDRSKIASNDGGHSWAVNELEVVGPEAINKSFGVLFCGWIDGWLGQRLGLIWQETFYPMPNWRDRLHDRVECSQELSDTSIDDETS